ncbi:MAG: ABC transporter permease [Bacteroidales bacterium]|nr:ABC transporter permease [Bacteroidales bacterium]
MGFNKIKIIIGREYSVRVKKKSFILTTILTPLLFAALIAVPSLIMLYGGGKAKTIMVVDQSGLVADNLENTEKVTYQNASQGESVEDLKSKFKDLDCYAVVGISALDSNNNVNVVSYSKEPLNMDIKSSISKVVKSAVEDNKLASYNISNLNEIMAKVQTDVKFDALTITDDGGEKKDSVEIYMIIAYVLSFMIYGFVFMFGTMVMRSVIEEKTNRIIEVIVSSVKSFDLMIGKIIGVAFVALTQFFIWIVLTLGILMVFNIAVGKDAMKGVDTGQIAQMAGGGTEQIAEAASTIQDGSGDSSFMQDALIQIKGINFPYIIGCFLIYFLLGYLLYAAMFAAVGSAVDNEADTQQLTLPITLPLILGLFIMLSTFQDPNSSLSFWASIIPFTSPMVMMARIPFGVVPLWQLLLSIGLLILTFLFVVYISAKIYRVGILMYGKKATFKDLFKWIKTKN